jgi:hypothetical protein
MKKMFRHWDRLVLPRTCANFGVTVTVTVDGVPSPSPGLARVTVTVDGVPGLARRPIVELIRVTSQRQFRHGLISNALERAILLGAPNFLTYRER